jgi:hypothetical protein
VYPPQAASLPYSFPHHTLPRILISAASSAHCNSLIQPRQGFCNFSRESRFTFKSQERISEVGGISCPEMLKDNVLSTSISQAPLKRIKQRSSECYVIITLTIVPIHDQSDLDQQRIRTHADHYWSRRVAVVSFQMNSMSFIYTLIQSLMREAGGLYVPHFCCVPRRSPKCTMGRTYKRARDSALWFPQTPTSISRSIMGRTQIGCNILELRAAEAKIHYTREYRCVPKMFLTISYN